MSCMALILKNCWEHVEIKFRVWTSERHISTSSCFVLNFLRILLHQKTWTQQGLHLWHHLVTPCCHLEQICVFLTKHLHRGVTCSSRQSETTWRVWKWKSGDQRVFYFDPVDLLSLFNSCTERLSFTATVLLHFRRLADRYGQRKRSASLPPLKFALLSALMWSLN